MAPHTSLECWQPVETGCCRALRELTPTITGLPGPFAGDKSQRHSDEHPEMGSLGVQRRSVGDMCCMCAGLTYAANSIDLGRSGRRTPAPCHEFDVVTRDQDGELLSAAWAHTRYHHQTHETMHEPPSAQGIWSWLDRPWQVAERAPAMRSSLASSIFGIFCILFVFMSRERCRAGSCGPHGMQRRLSYHLLSSRGDRHGAQGNCCICSQA
jgi:hypothetical protein